MQYSLKGTASRDDEELFQSLEPIVSGLGMSLIELSVFRGKGRGKNPGIQVKAVVLAKGNTGLEECSRVHRAILPRLELSFPERDVYLEVSSPGIDRLIKDGNEFVHYIGRGVKCYRTDISDWTAGILLAADEKTILLKKEEPAGAGEITLPYEIIAKARLDGTVK